MNHNIKLIVLLSGCLFFLLMSSLCNAEQEIRVSLQNSYTKINLQDLGLNNKAWTISGYALNVRNGDSIEKFLSYNEDQIRSTFRTYLKKNPELDPMTQDLITLDLENPVNPKDFGDFTTDSTLQKRVFEAFKVRIRVAREELPNAKLSLYGVVVATASDSFKMKKRMQGYVKAGELGVYDNIDFLSPVLYMRRDNALNQVRYAETLTRQGIELTNQLRSSSGSAFPLAPFLAPNLYNKMSSKNLQCVPINVARTQLKILSEYPSVRFVVYWLGTGDGPASVICPPHDYFEELKR